MAKESLVARISLAGGLVGAVGTNPRKAIQDKVDELAPAGWYCHQILPHATRNILVIFVQLLILLCTLGIWTFGSGYLLLFHRDSP
ncbi:MAG: hypothetical protein LBU79_00605 [Planctomycetota bacterium]|jgi:hypothetical protein|nr:hypothetical protein [Planctomycetota bacterium]